MDRTLKALADPTRRAILRLLRAGDRTAGEIAERYPMTAASVSHHLRVLREAGLVSTEREGRNVIYSLNTTVLQEVLEEVLDFLGVGEAEAAPREAGGAAEGPAGEDATKGDEA